jgi:tetratricopeptide (TPR) repeat protein
VAFAVMVAALFARWKREQYAQGALIVLLVLYAGRTLARNANWNDDLTLATADVATTPRSFRLHDMLAKALFEQDPQRNLDRAIAEQEKSWDIVKGLPAAQSTEYPPTFLGIYYSMKADSATLVDAQAPKRIWYTKSVDVLLRAREISQAQEKAYDEEQRAHGRPLTARAGFPQLYFNLANDYLNLGNFAAAAEALRYGRGLAPQSLEAYDGLSIAYSSMGDLPRAAAALTAKAQLDGFQQGTLAALRDVYQKMPDASCAFAQQSLNSSCPRVKTDLCQGAAELVQAFTDARQPEQAAQYKSNAAQRWGCQ